MSAATTLSSAGSPKSKRRPEKYARLLATLRNIQNFKEGWNGPRSQPVGKHAVALARQFIELIEKTEELSGFALPAPSIGPKTTGGIAFEWNGSTTDGRELVVFIENDKTISFVAAEDSNSYECSNDAAKLRELEVQMKWLLNGR